MRRALAKTTVAESIDEGDKEVMLLHGKRRTPKKFVSLSKEFVENGMVKQSSVDYMSFHQSPSDCRMRSGDVWGEREGGKELIYELRPNGPFGTRDTNRIRHMDPNAKVAVLLVRDRGPYIE